MPKVSKEQYLKLMEDRPRKFSPADVDYRAAKPGEPICAGCMHYFVGLVMNHNVCEIMRPDTENVEPEGTCDFHTRDGKTFPLLRDIRSSPELEDQMKY